jgi:integrase family protein with SAM-like domain
MFNQLFFRSDALTRQLSAPLVDERRQYLAHCAAQGMSKCTLRMKARLLLSIAEYLRLAERPNDAISLVEIEEAASRWSRHNWPSPKSSHAKRSQEYFMAQGAGWLTFLNRLQTVPKPVTVCGRMLAEFRSFMKEDRGLSPTTVKYNCSSVRPFLHRLLEGKRSLEAITVSNVDSLLAQKVNEEHYARVSIRDYASSLRSFFRYAEMRGWCPVGIAASIMAPRVFQHETLPSGPTWDVVQDILDATAGDRPIAIRDHAILMLLAVYGVRIHPAGSGVATGTSPKSRFPGVSVTVKLGFIAMRDCSHTTGSSDSLLMSVGPPSHTYSEIARNTESSLRDRDNVPQYEQVGSACAISIFRLNCMSACCVILFYPIHDGLGFSLLQRYI